MKKTKATKFNNISEMFEKYNVSKEDQKGYVRIAVPAFFAAMALGGIITANVINAYHDYREHKEFMEEINQDLKVINGDDDDAE